MISTTYNEVGFDMTCNASSSCTTCIIIILPALQQVSFGHRCLFDRRCTGGDCHQRRQSSGVSHDGGTFGPGCSVNGALVGCTSVSISVYIHILMYNCAFSYD